MNKKTIFRIFPHICKMVFLLLFTHRYVTVNGVNSNVFLT